MLTYIKLPVDNVIEHISYEMKTGISQILHYLQVGLKSFYHQHGIILNTPTTPNFKSSTRNKL